MTISTHPTPATTLGAICYLWRAHGHAVSQRITLPRERGLSVAWLEEWVMGVIGDMKAANINDSLAWMTYYGEKA